MGSRLAAAIFLSFKRDQKEQAMTTRIALAAVIAAAFAVPLAASAAADADAAEALLKKNNCTKCHSVDKAKKGPSYKKVAEKYKGKADGEEKIIKNITTSPKVKLDDGTEEEHKVIDTKDPKALKNLAQWILER
jgi:cytochrome c